MKIEIYSDLVCPWCYIGERRFARALAAYPRAGEVEVVYRSYQLDPDAPAAAVPHLEYMRGRYGASVSGMLQQVTDAARGEGIEMDWDEALAVNTLTAHRLLRLAEREYGAPTQRALTEKLFDAHFSRGGDLADHELLADLAVSVGMDGARVRSYLASAEGLEETRYEIDQARRLGIRSVPTFVFEGQFAVQGAQPASVFVQALEEVAQKIQRAPAEGVAAEDDVARPGNDAACEGSGCTV
jgi:predicted DsbA family dithiol-disulfide isomerase